MADSGSSSSQLQNEALDSVIGGRSSTQVQNEGFDAVIGGQSGSQLQNESVMIGGPGVVSAIFSNTPRVLRTRSNSAIFTAQVEQADYNRIQFETIADVNKIINRSAESSLSLSTMPTNDMRIYLTVMSMVSLGAEVTGFKEPKLVSAETTLQFDNIADSPMNFVCVEASTNIRLQPIARVFRNIYTLSCNSNISLKGDGYHKNNKMMLIPTRRTQTKLKNISGQTLQIRLVTSQRILTIPPNDIVTININELDLVQIAKLRNEYLLSVDL